jgi:predicted RNase H-like nuclease (RuvC/YqgF family)
MRTNIAQAQQNFIKYTRDAAQHAAQKEDLQQRLDKANSNIAALQAEFESPTRSIEISHILFEAAEDTNVTITKLTSSLPEEEKLNGVTYQIFTLNLTAEGELVALLNFSNKLSEVFSTSTLETVSIKVPETKEGSKEKPSITLSLKIYAYESE